MGDGRGTRLASHRQQGWVPTTAACDLDEVPIDVGQSKDGIRSRVSRHLTSARSDIIANRQIDVWEIAYVWAYPIVDVQDITPTENRLYHH